MHACRDERLDFKFERLFEREERRLPVVEFGGERGRARLVRADDLVAAEGAEDERRGRRAHELPAAHAREAIEGRAALVEVDDYTCVVRRFRLAPERLDD